MINRKKHIDKLMVLWREVIKLRDGKCRLCGELKCARGMHAHHHIGRRYKNTRYEPDNGVYLCASCHNEMHDFPRLRYKFAVKCIGSDRYEELEMKARSLNKIDRDAIEASLKEKIKILTE